MIYHQDLTHPYKLEMEITLSLLEKVPSILQYMSKMSQNPASSPTYFMHLTSPKTLYQSPPLTRKVLLQSSCQFDHCVLREGHRTPIPQKSTYSSSKTLELVHSDLCGPLEGPCLGGSRYFMTSIHDFSRWTTVHTIKNHSDTPQCFIKIHKLAETHTGCKLKIVRTDNGWEYVSNDFIGHLNNKGIVHHTTNRYTPHRNGAEERMSLTLVNRIRSMLQTNSMSKYFWAEALERAAYIRSRVTR